MKGLVIIILLICPLYIQVWGSSNSRDKVLLEKVTAITLEEGKKTNGRRSSPISQLECVGGSAGCYSNRPKVVQCINVGFDGSDVQWECKADLDSKYRFGRLDVSCEGYDYPDDPYILKGSCGLKYELDLTEEGHRARSNSYHRSSSDSGSYSNYNSRWFGIGLLELLIIVTIIYCCCLLACMGGNKDSTSCTPSGSGSLYDGGDSTRDSSEDSTEDRTYNRYLRYNRRPGFWSGAATGGALGYMLGNGGGTGEYSSGATFSGGGGSSYSGGGGGSSYSGGGGGSSYSGGGGGSSYSGGGGGSSYSGGGGGGSSYSGGGGRGSSYSGGGGGGSSSSSSSSSRLSSGYSGTSRR